MGVEVSPIEGTVVESAPMHVLVLGDQEFVCSDKLPMSTLIRYADNDLLSLHHILVKLVDPDDLDRMWDAFEELDPEEVNTAIGDLVTTYSERPTERPSSSRRGSRNTGRK